MEGAALIDTVGLLTDCYRASEDEEEEEEEDSDIEEEMVSHTNSHDKGGKEVEKKPEVCLVQSYLWRRQYFLHMEEVFVGKFTHLVYDLACEVRHVHNEGHISIPHIFGVVILGTAVE